MSRLASSIKRLDSSSISVDSSRAATALWRTLWFPWCGRLLLFQYAAGRKSGTVLNWDGRVQPCFGDTFSKNKKSIRRRMFLDVLPFCLLVCLRPVNFTCGQAALPWLIQSVGLLCVQFEFEFLAWVCVQTSVNLLTGCCLEAFLLMQIFGVKLRPVPVSKLKLVYTFDQSRFTHRHWPETRTLERNSFWN